MLSNAPTDNLYKFATFIGMALFVFCTWQMSDTAQQIERQLYDTRMQQHILMLRLRDSQASLERLEQATDNPTDQQKEILKKQLDALGRESETMRTQWETNLVEEGRAQLHQLQYVEDDKTLLQVGQWGGLALSVIGIVLWYLLHQRHQDGLLRQQRQSAEVNKTI